MSTPRLPNPEQAGPETTPTFMFETLPSYQARETRNGATGYDSPNDTWKGYLSPENRYTMDKLQILEPRRHANAVMAERAKFKETTPVFIQILERGDGNKREMMKGDRFARHGDNGLVKYSQGSFKRDAQGNFIELQKSSDHVGLKASPHESAPVHEFILGRKFKTPNFAIAQQKERDNNTEGLTGETISIFSDMVEDLAKRTGQQTGSTYYSIFDLKDRNAKGAFTWIDEPDREYNALNSQTEIGSFSIISPTPEGPETIRYSIFEDENGPSIHRHVWVTDPNFQMPDYSQTDFSDLKGDELSEYDRYLAGTIENLHRMEQSVQQGYATVDNIEAQEAISLAAVADTDGQNNGSADSTD